MPWRYRAGLCPFQPHSRCRDLRDLRDLSSCWMLAHVQPHGHQESPIASPPVFCLNFCTSTTSNFTLAFPCSWETMSLHLCGIPKYHHQDQILYFCPRPGGLELLLYATMTTRVYLSCTCQNASFSTSFQICREQIGLLPCHPPLQCTDSSTTCILKTEKCNMPPTATYPEPSSSQLIPQSSQGELLTVQTQLRHFMLKPF